MRRWQLAGAADGTRKRGRTDAEISALLERSRTAGSWHIPMLKAIASMIGRGWPNNLIRLLCAPYCEGKLNDADLDDMIDRARKKWQQAGRGGGRTQRRSRRRCEALEHGARGAADRRQDPRRDIRRAGGVSRPRNHRDDPDNRTTSSRFKTSIATAGGTRKAKLQSVPMGTYWISSPKRRQYDGGMAFMPQHDGDVGNRLNLWRGFGVKAIKPDGKSGAAGCQKFLDFMRDIICSGNEAHFDYLLKREATILQKRIRSEVALGLRTKEEGCGKGFYEATMGRLLGNHAMQVTNPKHIIGNFNPHLETLLRLTADEALFVGNPEHRNALFGLITEPTLTIEPKGCGVYKADSYLNLSITSNCRALPAGQRDGATVLYSDRVGRAQTGLHEYFAGLQGRTRQWRLRGAALSPAARGRPHGFQRPQGAADGRAEAAARSQPAAAGGVVVRAAGDRHACGEPIRRSRTGRSATAISA